MKAIFDNGPFAPCPAPFNLTAHVMAQADENADKIALSVISPTHSDDWSYRRLKQAVLGVGTGLLQRGYRPGDILLMRLGNTVEFPIAYLGAIAVGLVPVPTSAMLTAPEVARMIQELRPRAVLRDPAVACPDLTGPDLANPDLTDLSCDSVSISELNAMQQLPAAQYHMGDPNRLAYLIYTSGTSGQPRAVMHAHRAIWARQMMHRGWYGLRQGDRLLHAGAFNWTFTLGTGLMDPWSVGATALIPASGVAIEHLPDLLAQHDATLFAAAPGVYRKILQHHDKVNLPTLRHGLAAGEKLSHTICDRWSTATGGGKIYEAYGMSECSTFISANPDIPALDGAQDAAQDGALGQPQPGRNIALRHEDQAVNIGEEGEICIHRSDPGLMLGYFNAPKATASRFDGEWFKTGDYGIMTADGQIYYRGRGDDMMNAGGYRVSPLEVEAALSTMPGVTQIAVTDVKVKEDTRLIIGFYTAPQPIDTKQLLQHAAGCLARYKQPRDWVHLDQLPTNSNGKLSRKALRDLYKP